MRKPSLGSRPLLVLLAGLVFLAVGLGQWFEDRRARVAGIQVTGTYTGNVEERGLFPEISESGVTLHPEVSVELPGLGTRLLVLDDAVEGNALASRQPRLFLYLPDENTPTLRLPERVSPWGGAVIWWCLGIGAVLIVVGIGEMRARRA